jgi:hypothetical protein
MTWLQEKVFFAGSVIAASFVSWLGALAADPSARWVYVTLSASMLFSAFLSLVFRKPDEGISLVVGRCGIAIIGGVFGTRLGIGFFDVQTAYTDVIYLAGVSNIFCGAAFLIGIAFLRAVDQSSDHVARRILDWLIGKLK